MFQNKDINKRGYIISQSLNSLEKFQEFIMSMFVEYAPFILGRRYLSSRSRSKRAQKHTNWQNITAVFLILAAIASGVATYAALAEAPPFGNNPNAVIWLLNLDLVILLALAAVIGTKVIALVSGRKRKMAGSHLHVRLVYTFSILAAAPAIIMTVFSAYFFHFGVQTWFSDKVQTTVNESQAVAEAYLEEHKQVIRADVLAMANDLNRQSMLFLGNAEALDQVMQTQSVLRNLSEAIIFDRNGRVLARSGLTFSLEFEEIPEYVLDQAAAGEVIITTAGSGDRVRALVMLNSFVDSYLYVGRMVDPDVLAHLQATQEAVQSYKDLANRYSNLQITVNLIFVVVGLLLVFVAIWFGLLLARQLVSPIKHLIAAADSVRGGDLTTRVDTQEPIEEFEYLGRSFNRMTSQIQQQQNELIQANRQLDRRRRLTETVLEGVSSGIFGVDNKGIINLANSSSAKLLGVEAPQLQGRPVTDIFPPLQDLIDEAHHNPGRIVQGEIPIVLDDGHKRIFLVRVAMELVGEEEVGSIITFDDITELQSAQRKAAWSDVARRIAHEIKNPLTPIQLSAERLKRRYLHQINDDPEIFSQCTDTIIKHVGDIGRMVSEFSSFARMPEPMLKKGNVLKQIEDVLFLHKQAHSDIAFQLIKETDNIEAEFDFQQIRQAFTNIIQNSIDSIEHKKNEAGSGYRGTIDVFVGHKEDMTYIALADNGYGFPKGEDKGSLTEPYITHKEKGTGLGLAIVKKIMEDHNGQILLGAPDWMKKDPSWRDLGGASVVLLFKTEHM